jgi:hypothetical protein
LSGSRVANCLASLAGRDYYVARPRTVSCGV